MHDAILYLVQTHHRIEMGMKIKKKLHLIDSIIQIEKLCWTKWCFFIRYSLHVVKWLSVLCAFVCFLPEFFHSSLNSVNSSKVYAWPYFDAKCVMTTIVWERSRYVNAKKNTICISESRIKKTHNCERVGESREPRGKNTTTNRLAHLFSRNCIDNMHTMLLKYQ